jgi:hypothetical protein
MMMSKHLVTMVQRTSLLEWGENEDGENLMM